MKEYKPPPLNVNSRKFKFYRCESKQGDYYRPFLNRECTFEFNGLMIKEPSGGALIVPSYDAKNNRIVIRMHYYYYTGSHGVTVTTYDIENKKYSDISSSEVLKILDLDYTADIPLNAIQYAEVLLGYRNNLTSWMV